MSDIRHMQLGQVVDFVIVYNERQKESEKQSKKQEKQKRKASQNDIDLFFG